MDLHVRTCEAIRIYVWGDTYVCVASHGRTYNATRIYALILMSIHCFKGCRLAQSAHNPFNT